MKKTILCLLLVVSMLTACGIAGDANISLPCQSHLDNNYSGDCDFCGTSVLTTFDFYCINDLHGKLADGENHPGVDELSTYLEFVRSVDDNVVILSAGDMWQGSSESNLTRGQIMTDWMNDVGFAAMTLGNHEFDWGEEHIESNAALAEFPFLAINIYDRTTDTLVDYCQPSTLIDADGIQIGIIGAIGDCYSSISADKVEDVYFKTDSQLTALVKEESQRLRSQGADFIIYVIHDGYGKNDPSFLSDSQLAGYYDPTLSDGYVDLVFEGHTHQKYLAVDAGGVYHLQNRGDNKGGICHVEVEFNTVHGTFDITQEELIGTGVYSNMEDDPIVEELLDKYAEQLAPANKILGNNSKFRSSDYLRQLVADLYYDLGMEVWAEEYDIALGGGFISARSPYDLPAGEVKYAQLQSIFPFDNDLVLCSVKGSDLLAKFINTSNRNYYVCGNVDIIADIDPNGIYYVVVDTYTSSYAPNRLTVVEEYEKGIYARDLLAEFIENGGLN